MKISQSKVRVEMPKHKLGLDNEAPPKTGKLPPPNKSKKPAALPISPIKDDYSSLREAVASVERIKASAQQELEQIRKMRVTATRYQQETATRARSEANQLILHARLATQREIEELIRQASEEIQKMLADIRVIRITAQEELAAQRKFTDAAKLNSMSFSVNDHFEKTVTKSRRQPVATK